MYYRSNRGQFNNILKINFYLKTSEDSKFQNNLNLF